MNEEQMKERVYTFVWYIQLMMAKTLTSAIVISPEGLKNFSIYLRQVKNVQLLGCGMKNLTI
jgi:hypothetical protein